MSKAVAARRVIQQQSSAAPRPDLKLADSAQAAGSPGPALALQRQLSEAFLEDEPRWSPRSTMAFILLTCGGFWLAVGVGMRMILG